MGIERSISRLAFVQARANAVEAMMNIVANRGRVAAIRQVAPVSDAAIETRLADETRAQRSTHTVDKLA